jgi:cytochrome c biogenesis protein CcmG/thiol:disulfide interchange protein DsbE
MSFKALIPVGLFAIIAVFLAIGLQRDPSVIPTEMIDKQMPAFELSELRAPETMVTDADLIGQISLVNVFGSWCVACLIEHPTLMRLQGRDDVHLIGVNWRDERQIALDWLAKHGDPYSQIAFDAESNLVIELGVTGAPETFVVGPDGRIRYKYVGPITDDVLRDVIEPVIEAIKAEANVLAEAA